MPRRVFLLQGIRRQVTRRDRPGLTRPSPFDVRGIDRAGLGPTHSHRDGGRYRPRGRPPLGSGGGGGGVAVRTGPPTAVDHTVADQPPRPRVGVVSPPVRSIIPAQSFPFLLLYHDQRYVQLRFESSKIASRKMCRRSSEPTRLPCGFRGRRAQSRLTFPRRLPTRSTATARRQRSGAP